MNASIQQFMAANSWVWICAGTRHPGINGEGAGETWQARSTTPLTGKFLPIVCLIYRLIYRLIFLPNFYLISA